VTKFSDHPPSCQQSVTFEKNQVVKNLRDRKKICASGLDRMPMMRIQEISLWQRYHTEKRKNNRRAEPRAD
jgi:hypothetical protein